MRERGYNPSFKQVGLNDKDPYCLYNFIKILSIFLTSILLSGLSWKMN